LLMMARKISHKSSLPDCIYTHSICVPMARSSIAEIARRITRCTHTHRHGLTDESTWDALQLTGKRRRCFGQSLQGSGARPSEARRKRDERHRRADPFLGVACRQPQAQVSRLDLSLVSSMMKDLPERRPFGRPSRPGTEERFKLTHLQTAVSLERSSLLLTAFSPLATALVAPSIGHD